MTIQSNNNDLNYLVDPTFTKANRLFFLPFARISAENNTTKDHRGFSYYYVPNVEIKDFSVLIGGKSFIDLTIKNAKEAYKKLLRQVKIMTKRLVIYRNCLRKKNCGLIATDLRKQTKLKDPQQNNFIGKLEEQANGAKIFYFFLKNQKKIVLNFYKVL